MSPQESQQALFKAFAERDLWKEARDRSAKSQQSWWVKILAWLISLVMGVKPKIMQFGSAASVMCVDLNKYRTDIDVEMLIDMGVRLFMLRVGGPTRWVYGDERYEVDSTFVPYYERIRAYAKKKGITVWIMGYAVHNAWSNEVNNYNGLDPQVTWLKEATRNHLCDLYCWDDEIGATWKDGKETSITPVNLVKSISRCMEQTFLEMERWPNGSRKLVVHYSAIWFIKQWALNDYMAWLDNNNRDIETRHFLTWRAWVPTVFSVAFETIGKLFEKVISPTGLQDNAFLRVGSGLIADIWQCTFTAMGPWCPKKADGTYKYGIDASISYGPSATIQQLAYCANLVIVEEDRIPPTQPGMLTGSIQNNQVHLQWVASTDAVGVVGYQVTRDAVVVGQTTAPAYSETAPAPGVHLYTVTAKDAAGNVSQAAAVSVTVQNPQDPPSGDFVLTVTFNKFLEGYHRHTHPTGSPLAE